MVKRPLAGLLLVQVQVQRYHTVLCRRALATYSRYYTYGTVSLFTSKLSYSYVRFAFHGVIV